MTSAPVPGWLPSTPDRRHQPVSRHLVAGGVGWVVGLCGLVVIAIWPAPLDEGEPGWLFSQDLLVFRLLCGPISVGVVSGALAVRGLRVASWIGLLLGALVGLMIAEVVDPGTGDLETRLLSRSLTMVAVAPLASLGFLCGAGLRALVDRERDRGPAPGMEGGVGVTTAGAGPVATGAFWLALVCVACASTWVGVVLAFALGASLAAMAAAVIVGGVVAGALAASRKEAIRGLLVVVMASSMTVIVGMMIVRLGQDLTHPSCGCGLDAPDWLLVLVVTVTMGTAVIVAVAHAVGAVVGQLFVRPSPSEHASWPPTTWGA